MRALLASIVVGLVFSLAGLSVANAAPGPRTCAKKAKSGWQSVTDPQRISLAEIQFDDSVMGIQNAKVGKISLFCLGGKARKFPPKMKWKGKSCDLRMVPAPDGSRVVGKLLCK